MISLATIYHLLLPLVALGLWKCGLSMFDSPAPCYAADRPKLYARLAWIVDTDMLVVNVLRGKLSENASKAWKG